MEAKDLEQTLDKWYKNKDIITALEKKVKKYREKIEKYMDENGLNKLELQNFKLKRTIQNRRGISKKDVPKDIWDKYSKETSYYVYNLEEKK
jgi:hypothetical protein